MRGKQQKQTLAVWLLMASAAAAAVWMTIRGNASANTALTLAAPVLFLAVWLLGRALLRRIDEAEDEPEPEAPASETEAREEEDEPLPPESAEPDPDWLIVQTAQGLRAPLFQVLRGERQYHFHRLTPNGCTMLDTDALLPAGGTDEEIRARIRHGFSIDKCDISLLELSFGAVSEQDTFQDYYATAHLTLHSGRERRMLLISEPRARTPESVERFFDDVLPCIRMDLKNMRREETNRRRRHMQKQMRPFIKALRGTQDANTIRRLRIFSRVLTWLSLAVGLVWAVFSRSMTHRAPIVAAMTVLYLLPFFVMLLRPRYASPLMLQEFGPLQYLRKNGVDVVNFWLPPVILSAAGIFGDVSCNILDWSRASLWLIGFPAIGVLLSLVRAPERKRLISASIGIWLLLSFFSLGMVMHINCELDPAPRETELAMVTDKYVTGSKSSTFHLVLSTESGRQVLDVPRAIYNTAGPGSRMVILRGQGMLGIPHADVMFRADWEAEHGG